MRFVADSAQDLVVIEDGGDERTYSFYSKEAFEALSELWLKLGWQQKYPYTFTWFGRPIIQHPEDILRMQEAIFSLAPDVIIETGIAHGGSLMFSATLLKALGRGKVIGVDVEIRPHNRSAIEAHPLSSMITLIEGDSVAPKTLDRIRSVVQPTDKTLVILDSDHSYRHVSKELDAYWPLVSVGSYLVATDGIMQSVFDTPRGKPEWRIDNPVQAVHDFLARQKNFQLMPPSWLFNESDLDKPITAFPNGWLQRVS
jgi:cephalosporin hydroxylase